MDRDASGSFEWEMRSFLTLNDKQTSPTFVVGPYTWRLDCHPKGNTAESAGHVSLFLVHIDAATTPPMLSPSTSFSLSVKNCKDASKDCATPLYMVFDKECAPGYGLIEMLSCSLLDDGYLSKDGSLTVRVDITSVCSRWAKDKQAEQQTPIPMKLGSIGADLLALLDEPGDTADLTITAGGCSFPVHRLILGSRCPYFKTACTTALGDGSAASELTLEDADPGALKLLLRYLYGGVLDSCAHELLTAAATLADRLLLPDVFSTLCQRLLYTTTRETVVEDMLWAEQRGDQPLLSDLQKQYLDMADSIKPEDFELLAQRSPQLAARLHSAVLSSFKRQRTC